MTINFIYALQRCLMAHRNGDCLSNYRSAADTRGKYPAVLSFGDVNPCRTKCWEKNAEQKICCPRKNQA